MIQNLRCNSAKVKFIMISKIAMPEEVLVVENDQKETDSINL